MCIGSAHGKLGQMILKLTTCSNHLGQCNELLAFGQCLIPRSNGGILCMVTTFHRCVVITPGGLCLFDRHLYYGMIKVHDSPF